MIYVKIEEKKRVKYNDADDLIELRVHNNDVPR